LEKADATVTVCHSKTENVKEIVLLHSFPINQTGVTSRYSHRCDRDPQLRQRRMAKTWSGRH
jgi:hypothetical protein